MLISKNGEIKISDFGVARWAASAQMTNAGTVRGKVACMAPEYLAGGAPSPAGDLFALGVMWHELMTGQRLYRGQTDTEIAHAVLKEAIAVPSASRPELPSLIDELVMAA